MYNNFMKIKWVIDPTEYPGVTFEDISNTFIEPGAKIAPGCYIETLVKIDSNSSISKNSSLLQGAIIKESVIGPNSFIGQYTLIRNNTVLVGKNIIGPHSEISNSTFSKNASAYHKAFISDTQIGEGTQIGASVITANSWHDEEKHKTFIGKNVKIGVNVTIVAPIRIGNDVEIAAGSTITLDIKDKQKAFGRSRQINKRGSNENQQ